MGSADFLVNGSLPAGPILLTSGTTATLLLTDTTSAKVVEWRFIGASEDVTYPAINITGRGRATFIVPEDPGFGLTMVLQCTNGKDRKTCLICVGVTTQIAANETTERDADKRSAYVSLLGAQYGF